MKAKKRTTGSRREAMLEDTIANLRAQIDLLGKTAEFAATCASSPIVTVPAGDEQAAADYALALLRAGRARVMFVLDKQPTTATFAEGAGWSAK